VTVYLLRHASAVEAGGWRGGDASRPLSPQGEAEALRLGAFMASAGAKPGLVLSSPCLRALQTARIACGRLGYKGDIKTDEGLAPGCEPKAALRLIRSAAPASLLLAGPAPAMGIICSALAGGGRIAFKKGALACIDYNPGTGDGELLFLVWPGILPD